jgi:Flp pilus assembly protein CpaB
MKIRTVLLLVVAVVCGTAGSRLTKRVFSGPPDAPSDADNEPVLVLAAKQKLSAGTVLNDPSQVLEERTVARRESPEGAVHQLQQLRGRRLARPLEAQAILTAETLVPESSFDGQRTNGRQAVNLSVPSLGDTYFLPEVHVDVVCTIAGASSQEEARMVAQDVPLLGVQTAPQNPTGPATVTVLARREDVERLQQAAAAGSLRIVPRQGR